MKILVIDDEKMMRTLIERILVREGYDVVLATSGNEGVSVFSEDPDSFDLVIIDQSMKDLTGIATLFELRKLRSDLLCILSSGHQINAEDVPEELTENTWIFQKPYRSVVLVDKVASVLAEAPRGT